MAQKKWSNPKGRKTTPKFTRKNYNVMYGIGKAKYVVNFHDGKKKHKDGSRFYDIRLFKNKEKLNKFITTLKNKGYTEK